MLKTLNEIKKSIGNTPLKQLGLRNINLFAKLEYHNYMGSIKDRTAYQILASSISRGDIDPGVTIVEASSGNLAVSLAAMCHQLDLRFIPVVDVNINSMYLKMLKHFSHEVVVIDKVDCNGGYLLSKLDWIEKYQATHDNVFWTNQYDSIENYNAHYYGTGQEICDSFDTLDYVFIGVGSAGTVSGVSNRVKEKFPNVKVIAVDVDGSVIFGNPPKPRHIPGMGSGRVPPLLDRAKIDDVVMVDEQETIEHCTELFKKHGLFVGGSSGTVYCAIKKYFGNRLFTQKPNVVFICPDKGTAYANNIYDEEWLNNFYMATQLELVNA